MSLHRRARPASEPDPTDVDTAGPGDGLVTAVLPIPAPRPSLEVLAGGVVGGPVPDADELFARTVSATLMAGARGYLFDGPRTRPYIASVVRDPRSEGDLVGVNRTRVTLFTVPDVNGVPCTLTSHEVEILQRVAGGETSKVIGSRMGLSPGSVKNHLHRAGRRLGTTDRAYMVLLAMRAGAVV